MSASRRASPYQPVDGTITSLVAQTGGAERVAVSLDGRRAFGLAESVVAAAGLHVGDLLTQVDQERLLARDAPYRARDRALRLLGLRDRSSYELRLRLQQAAFSAADIDETIAWLHDLGYVNDARFAAAYAAEKARGGWGRRRIAAELAKKGIGRSLVDEVLDTGVADPADRAQGIEALTELARRRFGAQLNRDPQGAARRLAGFLGRRGYDWDIINAVVRRLQVETTEAENGPLP